jgi:hypothetical protein
MILGVISGMESFSAANGGALYAGTVKVAQFYRRRPGFTDTPLQQASRRAENEVAEIGRSDQIPAGQRNRNHGVWVTGRYTLQEGACVTVKIERKKGSDLTYDTGLFVLLMRDEAALCRLVIPFTENPNATMASGIIEGRFDIVPPDQFDILGYTFDLSRVDQYNWEPDEFFQTVIVEAETRKRPVVSVKTVETEKGQIKINRSPSRRNIKIK